jgi:hypothetical protein
MKRPTLPNPDDAESQASRFVPVITFLDCSAGRLGVVASENFHTSQGITGPRKCHLVHCPVPPTSVNASNCEYFE